LKIYTRRSSAYSTVRVFWAFQNFSKVSIILNVLCTIIVEQVLFFWQSHTWSVGDVGFHAAIRTKINVLCTIIVEHFFFVILHFLFLTICIPGLLPWGCGVRCRNSDFFLSKVSSLMRLLCKITMAETFEKIEFETFEDWFFFFGEFEP
jgi:hypothetical protein